MLDMTQEIANTLAGLFPDITIYRNNQKQGFKEPCFFIKQIRTSTKDELANHQFRNYSYDVLFFPQEHNSQACEKIAEKLHNDFTYLVDFSAKIIKKEHEIIENVLHFTFKLQFRVKDIMEQTLMNSLKEGAGLKNGK